MVCSTLDGVITRTVEAVACCRSNRVIGWRLPLRFIRKAVG
jgi:hypothetical protein